MERDMLEVEQCQKRASARLSDKQKISPIPVDSDDSDDDGRLQIAWEEEQNTTQSTHSEESQSTETSSTRSSIGKSIQDTILKDLQLYNRSPLNRWSSMITLQNHQLPIIFHKNMARNYPTVNRTPEQLETRRRNTEAARISRAKTKMAQRMMEKEAEELSVTNSAVKRVVAARLVYVNAINKLLNFPQIQLSSFKDIESENLEAFE
ncbi:uncharacterized protein LOC128724601 [Anopheles nili]|uniref:uncharacterized protein LOC128724601 n=1 Tax=Anopheles nili TaxID=185578 RepID=UPI00237A0E5B|nr:uncharacterized protein LOC128724601 [Anopheles nili]